MARWLREAGYSKESLARTLELPHNKLLRSLVKPYYFSIRQLMIISAMVQRPLAEVFFAALSHPNLKREMMKGWQDDTGIQLDEITEPKD